MKLTQILKEIKVNQPVNKMKAFKDMLDFDEEMLASMIQDDTLDSFIDGYDSLEDLLTDDYGVDNPQPYTQLITNYYNTIKPGDISIVGGQIMSVAGYKNIIAIQRDIGEREPIEYFLALKF